MKCCWDQRIRPNNPYPKKAWFWFRVLRFFLGNKNVTPIETIIEKHTIAVLVDNESGVLARVVGLFSGRGYNIESLTVAETDTHENLSRITIVTSGTPMIIEQIKAQLGRLVPVHNVRDLTMFGPHVERELALVKVQGTGDARVEALRIADIFRARALDSSNESFVFEIVGDTGKLDAFIRLMEPLGLIDVSRTGVAAIARGIDPLT
ncbi:MAG: acetolactate synthase small subunit [Rhodospirillaceae bacterium]|nr:acetolactate synthase small subunit [Rhodospirillaceae bacterium]